MDVFVTRTGLKVGAILKIPIDCSASGSRRWDKTLSVVDCCQCDGSSVSNTFIKTFLNYIFFGGGGGWYLLNDFSPSLL